MFSQIGGSVFAGTKVFIDTNVYVDHGYNIKINIIVKCPQNYFENVNFIPTDVNIFIKEVSSDVSTQTW